MVENKSALFGIIAIIIGASGLGIGAYSVVNFQIVEGPQGPPGEDGQDGIDGTNGTDGQDASGGLIIGILEPDQEEFVSGNVTIRALIYGSENYTISILRDGIEIGTTLPMVWNTTLETQGWHTINVSLTDVQSNSTVSDEVRVYVDNYPNLFYMEETDDINFDPGIMEWKYIFWEYMNPEYPAQLNVYVDPGEALHLTFISIVSIETNATLSYAFFENYGSTRLGMGIRHSQSTEEETWQFERVIEGLSSGWHNINVYVRILSGYPLWINFDNSLIMAQTVEGSIEQIIP